MRMTLLVVMLIAACGHKDPCDALGDARQQLDAFERESVRDWLGTKPVSTEQKDAATAAVFSELVATCRTSQWSKDVVDCFVAGAKAEAVGAAQPACSKEPAVKAAGHAFEDAEHRVLTKLLGPNEATDELARFGEAQERKAERLARRQREAEPQVKIPARYHELGWFSGRGAPALQVFRGQLPACAEGLLSNVDGYYQTQGLIAILGELQRDPAEVCLQETITRLVPGARLERDGALTRLVTTRTVGYFGWARDGAVYWNPDRAAVEEAVAQQTSIASNADVMALVQRVDRTKPMWFVMASDATSKLLGVPSTGVLFATDLFDDDRKYTAETAPRLPLTIQFASAADAKRAATAVRAPHPSLSRPLAAQLAKLDPVVRGSDVELDIMAVFSRPELIEELRTVVEGIKKQAP